ncbi:hypothetical protein AVEN_25489-1 [Araneus ventricosus]|uniref:Uncharacterized protein n=1 Tax=Araneus ventricosus TaxID=182803 RepID=A0A4Y2CS89_ARAVE|nr:hypothetical protein AVEN_25489-1 [Araneus ventricosus]
MGSVLSQVTKGFSVCCYFGKTKEIPQKLIVLLKIVRVRFRKQFTIVTDTVHNIQRIRILYSHSGIVSLRVNPEKDLKSDPISALIMRGSQSSGRRARAALVSQADDLPK